MTATTTTERPAVPPLTRPELGLAGVGAAAAAGIGSLGLLASFDAVSSAALRWGFADPWMLPVGIDVAIPVFTVANLLLIRMDMGLAWVRFVPWLLTLVTCGLNIAAGDGMWAKLAHGTMPLLWVVFSEIGAHIYAVRIGAVTGRKMDKIRWTRWLLAPWPTFTLWRRMTLWEITSYADALTRERQRQLARADLREEHGRMWRSKTPRRARVLLKLGALAPGTEPVTEQPEQPETPTPEAPAPSPAPRKPSAPRRRPAKAPARRTLEELTEEARELTGSWSDADINAEALRKGLHCGAKQARQVRDTLTAERAGTSLHAVDTPADDDGETVGEVAA
ncbi:MULTISPECIES: DUF2637 domain-containing protein [unclassified Streptomyces]|uniref:DUF2637 domain-containing protein n=1 Tax=unclassified Streptomyces TaxID=2593676 RepID=UPI000DB92D17|nr:MULTISPECIES: DUF2637 domain-containing protein [unclassified Streptomyces]MYT70722.1 DUF2637 domain-containing protein [Streptomyces sp. SID8367]RAJ90427.1 uncharacterized protein DUF2637 [Streptomyces sp. PsTaAH-137]